MAKFTTIQDIHPAKTADGNPVEIYRILTYERVKGFGGPENWSLRRVSYRDGNGDSAFHKQGDPHTALTLQQRRPYHHDVAITLDFAPTPASNWLKREQLVAMGAIIEDDPPPQSREILPR